MKLNFSHQELLVYLRATFLTDNPEVFYEPDLKWGTAFYEEDEKTFKFRLVEISYRDYYLGWEDPFMGLNHKLDKCFLNTPTSRDWYEELEFNSPKELMDWFLEKVKTKVQINESQGNKGAFKEVRRGKNKRKN